MRAVKSTVVILDREVQEKDGRFKLDEQTLANAGESIKIPAGWYTTESLRLYVEKVNPKMCNLTFKYTHTYEAKLTIGFPQDERIQKIKNWLYGKINNQAFSNELKDVIEDYPGDVIFSGKVQSGKTKILIYTMWLSFYIRGECPIITAWDHLNTLDQLKSRIQKFNQELEAFIQTKEFNLNIFEIAANTSIDNLLHKQYVGHIFITILQKERLSKLIQLISLRQNDKFALIHDEADYSIKKEDSQIEQMQQQLLYNYGQSLRMIYIGATNFILYLDRFRMQRQVRTLKLPTNLYENLVYRDLQSHQVCEVKSLKPLLDMHEIKAIDWQYFLSILDANFLNVYADNSDMPQPNIGLLNICHENHPKELLAEKLSLARLALNIIVYTGEGCNYYYNGAVRPYNISKGVCMGKILQKFKDDETSACGNSQPLLIIATGMASRAQTFKSLDNEWCLTHMFLRYPENCAMDIIVQSQRCNGQYLPTHPLIKIILSPGDHLKLKQAITNTCRADDIVSRYNHASPLDIICTIPYLQGKKQLKISNRIPEKAFFDKPLSGYHGSNTCYEKFIVQVQDVKLTNNISGYSFVTKFIELPINGYHELMLEHDVINPKTGLTPAQQFQTDKPYAKLASKFQSKFRNYIQGELRKLGYAAGKLQLAYTSARAKEHNKIYTCKPETYKCKYVCLDAKTKDYIPVVIYEDDYLQDPDKYENIVCYHSTDYSYRYYIPGADNDLLYSMKLNLK